MSWIVKLVEFIKILKKISRIKLYRKCTVNYINSSKILLFLGVHFQTKTLFLGVLETSNDLIEVEVQKF